MVGGTLRALLAGQRFGKYGVFRERERGGDQKTFYFVRGRNVIAYIVVLDFAAAHEKNFRGRSTILQDGLPPDVVVVVRLLGIMLSRHPG